MPKAIGWTENKMKARYRSRDSTKIEMKFLEIP